MINKSNALKLMASLLAPLAAGLIGSLLTRPSIPAWYAGLNKPAFNPPGWLFGPVWTILYLMMGTALYLVLREGTRRKDVVIGIALFALQLVLNVMWSFLFFYLHSPLAAFVEIIALWLAIACTAAAFFRVQALAGALLIPYLGWVSFASVLTFYLWKLNP